MYPPRHARIALSSRAHHSVIVNPYSSGSSNKPVLKRNWFQRCRIVLKLITNQVATLTLHSEGPRIDRDGAVPKLIANRHLLIAIIPGKDTHVALRWCFEAEIEGDPITQVRDAVDPFKDRCIQAIAL